MNSSVFIVGGAGFIGSNLACALLNEGKRVTIYDNFTSGKLDHLGSWLNHPACVVVKNDVKNLPELTEAIRQSGASQLFHFASNPDIARAMVDPLIDFWEGTFLTQMVVEAARQAQTVEHIFYASGSGVYGELGEVPVHENLGSLRPTSTYGASKLAGEALLCAYAHLYGLRVHCFRFANVVGRSQTHGVSYDFIRKLTADPTRLLILGDGRQSKSYVHVDDVIAAMRRFESDTTTLFESYNVATLDYLSVNEIADLAIKEMGLNNVTYSYTGGDRGWKGDIPIVRFDSNKIRALGWTNRYTSREAIQLSLRHTLQAVQAGLIPL